MFASCDLVACTPKSGSRVTHPFLRCLRACRYWWADGMKIKTPIKLPAHDYITHLSVWISKLLNSEKIFPLSHGVAYPTDFEQYIKVRRVVVDRTHQRELYAL